MWESPIQIVTDDIVKDIARKEDELLMESVHRVGFNIDKDELVKALNYDRDQYERGYADGRWARDSEIVRCKECRWFDMTDPCGTIAPTAHRCKRVTRLWMDDDAFCSYGERREDE